MLPWPGSKIPNLKEPALLTILAQPCSTRLPQFLPVQDPFSPGAAVPYTTSAVTLSPAQQFPSKGDVKPSSRAAPPWDAGLPHTYVLSKFLYKQQLPLPAQEDPDVIPHGASDEPGCGCVTDRALKILVAPQIHEQQLLQVNCKFFAPCQLGLCSMYCLASCAQEETYECQAMVRGN